VRIIVPVEPAEGGEARADQMAQEIAPKLLGDVARVLPTDRRTLTTAAL
jgi:hypothetical protein